MNKSIAVSPIAIDENSPFQDEACALCKAPFQIGDQIIVCPDDATRHHVPCWEANGNRCTAYGCKGHGIITSSQERLSRRQPPTTTINTPPIHTGDGRSKIRVLPFRNFSCARSCLWLVLSLTMLVLFFSCFGFLFLVDYLNTLS